MVLPIDRLQTCLREIDPELENEFLESKSPSKVEEFSEIARCRMYIGGGDSSLYMFSDRERALTWSRSHLGVNAPLLRWRWRDDLFDDFFLKGGYFFQSPEGVSVYALPGHLHGITPETLSESVRVAESEFSRIGMIRSFSERLFRRYTPTVSSSQLWIGLALTVSVLATGVFIVGMGGLVFFSSNALLKQSEFNVTI